MSWIDDRIQEYYAWMKDNTITREDNLTGWISISTPFIGLFNDHIQIYAKKENGKINLSDDGETISNLRLCGFEISRSPQRKEYLEGILKNYGITLLNNQELFISSSERDFPRIKHNLISAISEISDLEVMKSPNISSLFFEDVANYLKQLGVVYTPKFLVKGSTGLEYTFDYQIAHQDKEIVIKPFNNLIQAEVEKFLFRWEDIKSYRESITKKTMRGIAMINDEVNEPKKELIEVIESKQADIIFWSKRFDSANKNLLLA